MSVELTSPLHPPDSYDPPPPPCLWKAKRGGRWRDGYENVWSEVGGPSEAPSGGILNVIVRVGDEQYHRHCDGDAGVFVITVEASKEGNAECRLVLGFRV